MSDKWVVTENEEHYSSDDFNSREEAIANGREELCIEKNDGFWVGKKNPYIFPSIDACDFFNDFVERNCDEFGDWSEYWEASFRSNTVAVELINKKLGEIADIIMEHHKPRFYIVSEAEFIEGQDEEEDRWPK